MKCKLTYICQVYVNETLPGEAGREKQISAQGIQEVLWIGEKGVVLFQYKMISWLVVPCEKEECVEQNINRYSKL